MDVAHAIGLVNEATYRWLLEELGEEQVDPAAALNAAIAQGALVLVERPRQAYWKGVRIDVDWDQRPALWDYFWELCRQAKANQAVDPMNFSASHGQPRR